MLRILGTAKSINVRKVIWACDEIGIAYAREDWGTGFRATSDPEFLAISRKALVPVIIDDDDGFVLSESNAIIRYLAAKHERTDLLPLAPLARARVEEIMDWQATEFNTAWRYAFVALVRRNPAYSDQERIAASVREWTHMLAILEAQLAVTGRCVCGDAFTLADIPIGLSVNRWMMSPMDRPFFPAVAAYYDLLMERPAFRRHAGAGTD